jgi:hypothetical protein
MPIRAGTEMAFSVCSTSSAIDEQRERRTTRFDTLAQGYLQMELLQAGFAAGRRPLSGEDKAFPAAARKRVSEAVGTVPSPRS